MATLTRNEEFKRNLLAGKPVRYGQKVYSPDEYGTWRVTGEDPNCDFGGHHHEPELGTFTGLYKDVVNKAVDLPGFLQWGGGGKIVKETSINLSALTVDGSVTTVIKTKVWTVHYESVNGRHTKTKCFADKQDAEDFGKAVRPTNTSLQDAFILNDKAFIIDNRYPDGIEFKPLDPEKLKKEAMRKAALEKLTPEERKLLGIR